MAVTATGTTTLTDTVTVTQAEMECFWHCSFALLTLSAPLTCPGVSASDRSGKLKAGDMIVRVDGLAVTDETVADAVAGCDVPGNAARASS